MGNALSMAASVGVPLVGGMAIGMTIGPEIKTWYPKIKKPSWTPPAAVFPVAWTVLYSAMGVAAHRVWAAGGGPLPLGLYGAQLALNFAWSPLFFKKHDLKAATFDITALVGVLGATIYQFGKVDKLAGQLMLPYLGWVSFATALTWNIWLNNPEEGKRGGSAADGAGAKLAAGAESAARSVGDAMSNMGGAVAGAAQNVSEAVAGAASSATAAGATPFLAEGGERQLDEVPADVAAATAARSRNGNGAGASVGAKVGGSGKKEA